ncbi:hypothetical protein H1C71_031667 [Ictidomys tridecemlineatus]|nr:hypothetical protein H1C71_031667 [Ictidomys tridecemlineatus]
MSQKSGATRDSTLGKSHWKQPSQQEGFSSPTPWSPVGQEAPAGYAKPAPSSSSQQELLHLEQLHLCEPHRPQTTMKSHAETSAQGHCPQTSGHPLNGYQAIK